MINIIAQLICFALQIFIEDKCILHIIPMCHHVRITFNIHASTWNRLLRHLIQYKLLVINMNTKIIFFVLHKLIAITIVYHISYQSAIMSEIALNITLRGSTCNRLLRQFISWWLLMIYINAKIALYSNNDCISQIIPNVPFSQESL